VDFLALLHECVVLGDSLQRQLVHQVDLVRVSQVLPHECLNCEGKGSGVEEDLPAWGQVADHPVDAELLIKVCLSLIQLPIQHPLEILAEKLVGLVQHQHPALRHIRHLLLHQVQDPARGRHH
jgi:hypothetical protein